MDAITIISGIMLAGALIVLYGPRLGAALKIPLFVRWSNRQAERERIKKQRYSIRFDADAITVVDLRDTNSNPLNIGWKAIDRLTMFKRDIFSVDLICLFIEFSGDCVIEFDEDMEGWKAFIDALPHHLSGCKPSEEWFFDVAFPAFAANPNEIYRRQTPSEITIRSDMGQP
ncbi:MAG: hypothetical protein K8R23_03465 [Chthoniobacter sp.]|nr:hypothetical protein [Chthoniobacter sp.]